MFKRVLRFAANEEGATSIEYALIAGGISIVILAAVQAVAGSLQGIFTAVVTGLTGG